MHQLLAWVWMVGGLLPPLIRSNLRAGSNWSVALPQTPPALQPPPRRFKVERYMQLVFGLAAALLFVPVMYHQSAPRTTQTADK